MSRFQDKAYYINRELSWLAFNERVFAQAQDRDAPLFERLKFISITTSNLDEFFMVRVAGLKDQVKIGYSRPDNKTGMTPRALLREISVRVHADVNKVYRELNHELIPALRDEGIDLLPLKAVTQVQWSFLRRFFHDHVFPVLTPLAIDASHPFPMLSGRSLNLAVLLRSDTPEDTVDGDEELLAVVQVPSVLPRCVEVPSADGRRTYVFLEDVIESFIDTLFPGNRVLEQAAFRITRNADINVDEESAEDLLEEIEKELKKRRRGDAVRLEVASGMSPSLLEALWDWVELDECDIYTLDGPLDLTFLARFAALDDYDHLRYPLIHPQPPQDLVGQSDLFEAIAKKDVMMFHPFESFDPVLHFINLAADDPDVLAVKQTLYRVGGNSPVVSALARAAENGKQVTVLLELKARFDEENNIVWAKKLEEAGCHVIYGLVGLKTHSKIALVVRKEGRELRRYVHLSTGNYNEVTANLYTDIGMFTAKEDFGYDASAFFNHLTGHTSTPQWRQITTAPAGLKAYFLELIDRERSTSTPEHPGRIIAKMNALTDKDIIAALYEAASDGVEIDLLVRGICCLRPGLQGVSERIRVSSIVGRFLEHSRVFYFRGGGDEQVYLSSADWMTRNMISRVEILFPVTDEVLKARLKHMLEVQLADNVSRYELTAWGSYEKVEAVGERVESQMDFYRAACEQAARHDAAFTQITAVTTSR